MIRSFITAIRLKDWIYYLIPFLLGFVFVLLYISKIRFSRAIVLISLFLIVIVATASYGFLLNNIFDEKDDSRAGKENFSKHLSNTAKTFYIITFLVLSLLPWLFLPVALLNFGLFILQLLLLAVYSVPPYRLKRFVFTGVITDALYNSVIMVFVIVFTIQEYAGSVIDNERFILIVLFVLLFTKGLRGILLHQLSDRKNDRKANISTFVTLYGPIATNNIISKVLLPIESLALTLLIVLLYKNIPGLLWLYLGFLCYMALKYHLWNFRWIPAKYYLFYFRFTLNDFYEEWFPLFVLVLLCVRDITFVFVLIPYVFLFPAFFKKLYKDIPETVVNFKDDFIRKFCGKIS
jgi:1,4-dihydroxy-2-naphthoate octaprenyltransferase